MKVVTVLASSNSIEIPHSSIRGWEPSITIVMYLKKIMKLSVRMPFKMLSDVNIRLFMNSESFILI